jgi:molybdopterin-biosynthesis enzyme MoeA-like protein
VIVTGGLGGTHDDVTMEAVSHAFGRQLVAEDEVIDDVAQHAAAFRDENPELVSKYDLDLDVEAWARTPEGSRPLLNGPGLSPGCVVENVYVLPGIPEEMEAMFETVADEFSGDGVSKTIETTAPEGALLDLVDAARTSYDVAVGSYPSKTGPNRLKVTGTKPAEVAAAAGWLAEQVETIDH